MNAILQRLMQEFEHANLLLDAAPRSALICALALDQPYTLEEVVMIKQCILAVMTIACFCGARVGYTATDDNFY